MKAWVEAVAYQSVWFACVIGAGRGLWWPGVAAALPLAAWQVASSSRPAATATLGAAGLAVGLAVEGSLSASGLLAHAASPAGWVGPPPWILALWTVFAMTLHRSFSFLRERAWLACALGAVGGPLAYLAAARGWDAVRFADPLAASLGALAFGWALALPLLAFVARNRVGTAPVSVEGRAA